MEHFDPSTSFRNLKALLVLRGISLADLARKHGFNPLIFQQAARQYWGTNREPQGIKTDKMLKVLRQEIDRIRTSSANPITE